MKPRVYEGDAKFIVRTGLSLDVEAELFTGPGEDDWSGTLREVEAAWVFDVANSEDLRLVVDEVERRVQLERPPSTDGADFISVRIEGLGTPPF
jgi:hypothetical protein